MTDIDVIPDEMPENDNHRRMQAVIDAARCVVDDIRVSERTGKPRFPGYIDQLEDALREYEARRW